MKRTNSFTVPFFFSFPFILILLRLLNHADRVCACSNDREVTFHHRMYPVTMAAHHSWLSLRIYRTARCVWTKNQRPVPRMFNQPTSLDQVNVNNKLNAYTLLFEGEAANFSCACSVTLADCHIRFSVDFFAVRNAKGWWRSEVFDKDPRVQTQYPLHEKCMEREANFNAFYHFYLDKRQNELRRPHACLKESHPYNLLVRPIYLADKGSTSNVRVRCNFRGEPRPRVSIQFNGRPLKGNKKFILSYSSFGKFIIRNAKASDAGLVSCRASNRYGVENLYVLLFMVHRTSLSSDFSVVESEIVYNGGGNAAFVELTCPTPPEKTAMLVVWAEVRGNALTFMRRNVLRMNVTRATANYLCIVCFVNRCKLNRIYVSQGLRVRPGTETDEWDKPRIERQVTTAVPLEQDELKEKDTDLGQFIFWVVLGLYGCVFLVLMLRLSVARACRPISSPSSNKMDVRSIQNYPIPSPYVHSFSSYNSPSLVHSSYRTLFEEYVPMFSDCDAVSVSNEGRYEKLSLRHFMKIRILGEGYFGKVTLAKMTFGCLRGQLVAVKEPKDKPNLAEYHNTSSLGHETYVLRKIGPHRNVIRLLGWSSFPHPFLLTEFCSRGNLRTYLTSLQHDAYSEATELAQLKSFAFQIAQGMAFVASKQFVHGDLAARNILLTDALICKVADFGLARQMHGDSSEYRMGKHSYLPMPTRWLAPEALNDEIMTMTSDVWSFGVLVWEIFSVGATPYPDHEAREIKALINSGYRLPRPALCPNSIWSIIREAWSFDPVKRTSFAEIVRKLINDD